LVNFLSLVTEVSGFNKRSKFSIAENRGLRGTAQDAIFNHFSKKQKKEEVAALLGKK